jgi:hypothetical protein
MSTRRAVLAQLDPARTVYLRTFIGGLGSGRTRRETWGAFTADGVWEFEREESPGTPWWIHHLPSKTPYVTMCGSLRACREAVGRGWADRALAGKAAEALAEALHGVVGKVARPLDGH